MTESTEAAVKMHLVSWRDCDCEWVTNFCDENHERWTLVPRSVLEPAPPDTQPTP